MSSVSIEDILGRVDNLPTLSQVAVRVGELVSDPRVSAAEIAGAMRCDAGLSAKILRLVNSSYYAIPGGVSDVARAISFIGFNTLHQLVLSVSVLGTLKNNGGPSAEEHRGLWLHALAVGVCSEVLARRIGHRDPGGCFTAGLLHDVGKIALLITEPERYGGALKEARLQSIPMSQAEAAAGLPTHDRIGTRLARRWRFPTGLLAPIEHHHGIVDPAQRNEVHPYLLASIDIVNIADALCRRFALGDSGSPAPDPSKVPLATIGLLPIHVDEIYTQLMRRLEQSKVFLELVG